MRNYYIKEIANKGKFFKEKDSIPPIHLSDFVEDLIVFDTFLWTDDDSNCGDMLILIPYLYYFLKIDIQTSFVKKEDIEKYAREQCFTLVKNTIYFSLIPIQLLVLYEKNFDKLFNDYKFPDGSLIMNYKKEINQFYKWYNEEVDEDFD